VDFYLERDLDYSVHLEPDEALAAARVTGRLEVHLDNPAPPGIASYALGPNDPRFAPGENRSFVSVYTPLPFTKADVDGVERLMEVETELGRNVYSSFVSVPAGTSATLGLDLDGSVRLEDDGWYRLDLVRQPALQGDRVTIEITVPEGLRIADAVGLDRDGDRRATGRMTVEESTQVRVRLEPDRSRPSLWDRLIDGPEDTP